LFTWPGPQVLICLSRLSRHSEIPTGFESSLPGTGTTEIAFPERETQDGPSTAAHHNDPTHSHSRRFTVYLKSIDRYLFHHFLTYNATIHPTLASLPYCYRRQSFAMRPLITLFVLLSAVLRLSAASDEAGLKFLEENAKKPGVVTLSSGMQYKVLKKGDGKLHPSVGTSCSCHYGGTLIDGTKFDSSYDRGSPTTFAPNQVIKGWTEAMQL
jgi:hypothetical protein